MKAWTLALLILVLFADHGGSQTACADDIAMARVPSTGFAWINGALVDSVVIRIDRAAGELFVNGYNLFPGAKRKEVASPDSATIAFFKRAPFVLDQLAAGKTTPEAIAAYEHGQHALFDTLQVLQLAMAAGSLSAEQGKQLAAGVAARYPYSRICKGISWSDKFSVSLYTFSLPVTIALSQGTVDAKRDFDMRLQKCEDTGEQILKFLQHCNIRPRALIVGGGRMIFLTGDEALAAKAQVDAYCKSGELISGPLSTMELQRSQ